jgi:hypothetical protein
MNQVNNPIEKMKEMMKQVIIIYQTVLLQNLFQYIELMINKINKIHKLQIQMKLLKISRI